MKLSNTVIEKLIGSLDSGSKSVNDTAEITAMALLEIARRMPEPMTEDTPIGLLKGHPIFIKGYECGLRDRKLEEDIE